MSSIKTSRTKKISKPKEKILVQFNQIKGKKTGNINTSVHQWQ